jgi:ankyrin repeat protein
MNVSILAAFLGHLNVIKYFEDEKGLVKAEKVNSLMMTPLMLAANQGHLEVVRHLVEEKNEEVEYVDVEKNSAFYYACVNWHGQLDVVRYLYSIKSVKRHINDLNTAGETALAQAAYAGQLEIVQFLVEEAAADINLHDNIGLSPLDNAALCQPPHDSHDFLEQEANTGIVHASSRVFAGKRL